LYQTEISAMAETALNQATFQGGNKIKLHLNNINREEGFKLRKTWNLSTRLLSYPNAHKSGKSQEYKQREGHAAKKMK
jgi:hypothetical protein